MKYTITESRFLSVIRKFIDNRLSTVEVEEENGYFYWGRGTECLMLFDSTNNSLFIDNNFFNSISDIFGIPLHEVSVIFKGYMRDKGYNVIRII
jgi:hypothetical protein